MNDYQRKFGEPLDYERVSDLLTDEYIMEMKKDMTDGNPLFDDTAGKESYLDKLKDMERFTTNWEVNGINKFLQKNEQKPVDLTADDFEEERQLDYNSSEFEDRMRLKGMGEDETKEEFDELTSVLTIN